MTKVRGQWIFGVYSGTMIEVKSYLGVRTADNFLNFQFHVEGPLTRFPEWSLSMKLMEPILQVAGTETRSIHAFPAEKISFQWKDDNRSYFFNLEGIGANLQRIPLQEGAEIKLIDRSHQALSSFGRLSFTSNLYAALRIEPGQYLEYYTDKQGHMPKKFRVSLMFTVTDRNSAVLMTHPVSFIVQIDPKLSDGHFVNVDPDFSIRFSPELAFARLRFRSPQDYQNGVSVQYRDAIQVHASTDYEIRVKSLDQNLHANSGKSLPLSVLSLKLTPGEDTKSKGKRRPFPIATYEQIFVEGSSKDKMILRNYHVEYSAKLNSEQLEKVRAGNYEVSLLYLLLPK